VTSGGDTRPFVSPTICHSWRGAGSRSKKTRSRRESAGNETEARTDLKTEAWPGTQLSRSTRSGLFMLERVNSGRSGLHGSEGRADPQRPEFTWMGRLVRPIPVTDANHGFSGILTLELIQLNFSWFQFDLIGAKPPSGQLVPRRPLDARLGLGRQLRSRPCGARPKPRPRPDARFHLD
jgi:hypothetical protein